MSLEQQVMAEMKEAMKAKDEATLRGLRAIKAEIIKAKTEPGAGGEVTAEKELSMLQKMVKQRKDSLDIYQQQNREDLARKEEDEIRVIEKFLPKQFSPEELQTALQQIGNRRLLSCRHGQGDGCSYQATGRQGRWQDHIGHSERITYEVG
jgi:uncharacterized protein YqeY